MSENKNDYFLLLLSRFEKSFQNSTDFQTISSYFKILFTTSIRHILCWVKVNSDLDSQDLFYCHDLSLTLSDFI